MLASISNIAIRSTINHLIIANKYIYLCNLAYKISIESFIIISEMDGALARNYLGPGMRLIRK